MSREMSQKIFDDRAVSSPETSIWSRAFAMSVLVLLAAGTGCSGVAQAALLDRGGGLIYDDLLNVTWLQDANYANTQSFQSGGTLGVAGGHMSWSEANAWATNLVFHDTVRNVDLSGWRLPLTSPVNGTSFNLSYSHNGSTDYAMNITTTSSELSYMYYVNLGLKGMYSPSGVLRSDFGVFGIDHFGGQANVGLFKNIQSLAYWSGTTFESNPGTDSAFIFDTYGGYQVYASAVSNPCSYCTDPNKFYAWAVRPGDVAAVPEPQTLAMILAGLGLLCFAQRRHKIQVST